MTPDERAARAAAAMWATDEASKWLGMELGAVTEGRAVLTLRVAAHHCNGHGTCHGGVIFALADSAFAFACNSRNAATVAQHAQVSFTAPARAGDLLTAEAREVHQQGRNGIYDVCVTGPAGTVAEFRGMSRQVRGQLFEEET
ncbi:hydroxyphenylacetyl-CoA thioesterase PaaI [Jannaschia seohaensis]|uniref:Acyl-CoA thioesterase n=1 Tax=Jannaschia seohaensis TaxID=475081 RepID=A0A2Y9A1D2_9RHOB|nr:hydroxyphenylacetyl-CoA thioesterase PaaI [Jannaschia seohaensis]PWJ21926.1 acyl-CoA thioesterase [Jannaschia seohaensis]SSA38204.1 acyl-CoA thioesterase [Jannaschia seohaensis]